MKKVLLLACAFLFVSSTGFAQTPGPALLSEEVLAMILGEPVGASCATEAAGKGGVVYASEGIESACNATAVCETGTVTCSGNSSCTAVDRDCSVLEQGRVTCDGVTTLCPTTCCSSGTIIERACCRCEATGDCLSCCRCGGGTLFQCNEACS